MPQLSPNAAIPAGLRRKTAFDASGITKHAAGILFVAPDGDVLLLRRTGTPGVDNFVGHWALPGGGVEEGETPEVGAAREAKEEIGVDTDPKRFKILDQKATPNGMAFHTFAQPVEKKFWPTLNDEHNGAGWFPLNELPQPIHPAVQATLKDRLGEDFAAARDGLVAWANDPEQATDSAFVIAMDRDANRFTDADGHLHVKESNISKAVVNPYRGAEIPNFRDLGLDPDEVYQLLRDPGELEKSASSFHGKPLLSEHRPLNATQHPPELVIGTVMNPVWENPWLKAELVVWPESSIKDIQNRSKHEISCGYRYVAVMEPGDFEGMPFHGRMTQIEGNHVSLVVDGRVDGAVVGDRALDDPAWDIIAKALLNLRQ